MALLEVKQLGKRFGGLQAVDGVDLAINKGELVGVIGPNGAGKTTLFNLLTGVYLPSEGSIQLAGQSLVGLTPHAIARQGLSRTFQNIRLFKSMTVSDNVKVALSASRRKHLTSNLLRLPNFYKKEAALDSEVEDLLTVFGLEHQRERLASQLSYGNQRKLEIVRALATQPKILFLDEPAAGMNPQETAELVDLIRYIQTHYDLSVVLIEHDMSLVMNLVSRLYVLEYGRVIAEGTPEEVQRNPKVIAAYLGGEDNVSYS